MRSAIPPGPVPIRAAVDHLLLGVSALDAGCEWLSRRTGVEPARGGSHPGMGTRNALIALGNRQYLEVIAPDPAQSAGTFWTNLQRFDEPRLIGWAAATSDVEAIARRASADCQLLEVRDGSRTRPDGTRLAWKMLRIPNGLGDGGIEPIPFFIQWAPNTRHPSEDAPSGCALASFEIEHGEPAAVIESLRRLGLDAAVAPTRSVGLTATLDTPHGTVRLS